MTIKKEEIKKFNPETLQVESGTLHALEINLNYLLEEEAEELEKIQSEKDLIAKIGRYYQKLSHLAEQSSNESLANEFMQMHNKIIALYSKK